MLKKNGFRHSQCVVSKQHVGLYVESKLTNVESKLLLQLSLCGFDFCLFLFDRTAKIYPTEVSTCRGSFGGFESTCFQFDRAARIKTTGISYFSCDRSPFWKTLDLGGWMKMGGNNKIVPPNRFAQLKTFSCNRRFEKPQTLFLEKSLFLGRKWVFLGGREYWGSPKNGFGTIWCFLAIPKMRSKMSKSRIQRMPKL